MESTRQEKVARLIQKDLGDYFVNYARDMGGVLITVSHVRVTSDLGLAHCNLSIFPTAKGKEVLEQVNADKKKIRFDFGQKVRNQLRIVPELLFHHDETLDYLEKIDELLKK